MAQDELKDRILGWCSQASEIAVVQDREEPGAEVALLLRLQRPEGVRLGVLKTPEDDRVNLIHTLSFPPGSVRLGDGSQSAMIPSTLGEALERIIESRVGSLNGTTRQTSDGQEVTLTSVIYSDGLTKHAFLTGIQELARVRHALDRLHSGELAEVNPVFPLSPGAVPEMGAKAEVGGAEEMEGSTPDEPGASTAEAGSDLAAESLGSTGASAEGEPEAEKKDAAPAPSEEATASPVAEPEVAEPGTVPMPAAEESVETATVGPEAGAAPEEPTPITPQPAPEPTPIAAPTPVPVPAAAQPADWSPGNAAPSQPAPAPQPVPAAPAWTPSHRVPPAGMDAWAVPDPTQRAIARIDGGVPIQVTETAGAWAHILCSNGWSGWVDYRILVAAR